MRLVNPEAELILKNQLKSAYRKYKTHIYYDNYSAIQRCKLAEFECEKFSKLNNVESSFFDEDKIDNFFDNLTKKVLNNDLNEFLEELNVIAFPKKMKSNESNVISNYDETSTNIDQIHYFIDLPVEAHILGTLWILRCGYVLDDRLYKNCYGNRLNKHLLSNLKEKDVWSNWYFSNNFSPFLFEPYYKNYQSWRDNALNSVKNLLKSDKNAIMISLDFKNYYYSSSIDFKLLKKDIEAGHELIQKNYNFNDKIDNEDYKKVNINLTNFVQDVFKNYYKEFKIKYKQKDLPFIPLGFLPSVIIANWNLQGFDQAILEDIHPSYYGRYVDDILIVLDSHEKSETYGNQHFKELKPIDILKKYFTRDEENQVIFKIEESNIENDGSNNTKKDETNTEKSNNDEYEPIIKLHNIKHRIHDKDFCYENLEIQKNKVKLYSFSHNHSTSIIDNFKKEIGKNISEFKLMKDSDKLFSDFEEKLFEIDYVESINKLNNIKSVNINKFEISKLMSGVLNSSAFSSKNIDEEIIDKVIEAFQSNLFDFFILWEKLFTLLYVNNYENKLKRLIENILVKIDELTFDNVKKVKYHKKNDEIDDCELVKKSLKKYLFSTIVRVLSLKSTNLYYDLPIFIENEENIKDIYRIHSFNFILSSMINNSYMKYPLQNTFKIENLIKSNENNTKYDLIKENVGTKENHNFKGFCYPRYIKFHEILLNDIYNNIHFNSKNEFKNDFDELSILHAKLNFYDPYSNNENIKSSLTNQIETSCGLKCSNNQECPVKNSNKYESIKVGDNKKTKINVGLINTKLDINNFEKRLIGKPNLDLERFNKIKRLINEAINRNVDLLLMPEMYIPFEWVNDIINVSKVHQMAIIFGMEPIILDETSYNYILTSLPFSVDDKYFEAIVSCRLKNHYAPSEKQSIITNNLSEPDEDEKYYLYSWNGIHIAPFYCYELADIQSRGKFKSCCDIITVSEFNKDEIYFGNIAESLSRDNYCYCIKANTSEFGGNSIIQPAKSEMRKIVDLKGGDNDYLVVQELDINKLRTNAIKSDVVPNNKDVELKPNPPGLDIDIIKERMGLTNKYSKEKI